MAWVFPGESQRMADILSKGDFIVFQQNRHSLTFFAGGWGNGTCTVPLPENWLNNWHHIAGVRHGELMQIYINGILAREMSTGLSENLSSVARWVLGGNEEFPDKRFFKGKIDHFRVFVEALNQEDIQSEMLRSAYDY
jgi:hypothetical protein